MASQGLEAQKRALMERVGTLEGALTDLLTGAEPQSDVAAKCRAALGETHDE